MDLNIITTGQSNQSTSNRTSSERRNNRSYGESADPSESVYQGRLASLGIIPSKLEPFKTTDIPSGVYADESDPLGRTWYHIPNLGAKFCDAVRKYSIVANYREAHVIARKKSKDSECMWIGIVGDPASYTTGSKRHLIDMMLRNPGQSFENGSRRQNPKTRLNRTVAAGKRRKRRRRRYPFLADSRNETESSNSGSAQRRPSGHRPRQSPELMGNDNVQAIEATSSEDTDESEHLSSSPTSSIPSVLSMDPQVSNPYDFQVREPIITSPARIPPRDKEHTVPRHRLNLPVATTALTISTAQSAPPERDWEFVSVYRDPVSYALREPPMPSPDSCNVFSFNRMEMRVNSASSKQYQAQSFAQPRSPSLVGSTQTGTRKYSVSDLNDLLMSPDASI